MPKRPTSITFIGWLLIVLGVISLVASLFSLTRPEYRALMTQYTALPFSVQVALIFIGLAVTIVCGAAILKGLNWGRWLYLVWNVISILISLVTTPVRFSLLPSVILLAVVFFFLFRPAAGQYFKPTEPGGDEARSL